MPAGTAPSVGPWSRGPAHPAVAECGTMKLLRTALTGTVIAIARAAWPSGRLPRGDSSVPRRSPPRRSPSSCTPTSRTSGHRTRRGRRDARGARPRPVDRPAAGAPWSAGLAVARCLEPGRRQTRSAAALPRPGGRRPDRRRGPRRPRPAVPSGSCCRAGPPGPSPRPPPRPAPPWTASSASPRCSTSARHSAGRSRPHASRPPSARSPSGSPRPPGSAVLAACRIH